jgi:putative N6-adenine-specific DNA methylase
MDKKGQRPNSGPNTDCSVIYLVWKDNQATIYLDTSGETLSRHNYRAMSSKAPLQESLAAGIVMASGYIGESHFINPMCGTGTLAIEAALIGLNIAPGLTRRNFGFMHILGFQIDKWKQMRRDALAERFDSLNGRIIATDYNEQAVKATYVNAKEAGVEQFIEIEHVPFEHTQLPEGEGVIVLNPEYGERMGDFESLFQVYNDIGTWFKKSCSGKTGFVFTGSPDLAKEIGLKTAAKIPFMNAQIECRLLKFDLFQGEYKEHIERKYSE